jgi:hypothetical protein
MLPLSVQSAVQEAGAALRTVFERMDWRKLAHVFSYYIAPALGLAGIALFGALQAGFTQAAPVLAHKVVLTLLFILLTCLLLLYALFVLMIMTWDIDRISYAVEEESQRQLLKRLSSEKEKALADQDESEAEASSRGRMPAKFNAALENMIDRRAEYLWQQLLQSGCIDFPSADVKRAIKIMREEQPAENCGMFDAIKTLVVSKIFARSYVPRLRLKIMDKLVVKFVHEIAHLFISVAIVFLAAMLLWSAAVPEIFATKPNGVGVLVFVADLTLRGAIFTVFDHLGVRLTHLVPNAHSVLFTAHTLAFRLFMSFYVIATAVKVLKLVLRRKYMAG